MATFESPVKTTPVTTGYFFLLDGWCFLHCCGEILIRAQYCNNHQTLDSFVSYMILS